MTVVYVLEHDNRFYDMGDTYVRGVYADRAVAEADVVTRTPSGRVSSAYDRHTQNCCSVEEYDVLVAAVPDVKSDPPPPDPNAPRLIPDAVMDRILAANNSDNSLYRALVGRAK